MRTLAFLCAASLMLAAGCAGRGASPAAAVPEPTPAAAAAPAIAPAPALAPAESEAERIQRLVKQLGDAEFAAREQASRELAALGKKALPALEAAASDGDAERSARAKALIERINAAEEEAQAPDIPGLAEQLRGVRAGGHGPGTSGPQIRIQAGPGVQVGRMVRTGQDTRTVGNDKGSATVVESSEGTVSLTLTPKGGQAKTFSAASREEFKRKYPNLYAKYFGE